MIAHTAKMKAVCQSKVARKCCEQQWMGQGFVVVLVANISEFYNIFTSCQRGNLVLGDPS